MNATSTSEISSAAVSLGQLKDMAEGLIETNAARLVFYGAVAVPT
jgi:hypothetical protein